MCFVVLCQLKWGNYLVILGLYVGFWLVGYFLLAWFSSRACEKYVEVVRIYLVGN
jgi:hypothetical protein